MKLANIIIDGDEHLCLMKDDKLADLTRAGFEGGIEAVLDGEMNDVLRAFETRDELFDIDASDAVFGNIVPEGKKLVCVGLNYMSHAKNVDFKPAEKPTLFSKFSDALAPAGDTLELAPWETSYDYEVELVIVMGKTAWGVSKEEARNYVFGYSIGNDFSCRDAQHYSSQWLVGKTMPGFGPCGPCIITSDSFNPDCPNAIRSYVNGELRQNGTTDEMIFNVDDIVSYASHYIKLEPGDLIFTGTPSGVILEKKSDEQKWLKSGDRVDVEIEGIGSFYTKLA